MREHGGILARTRLHRNSPVSVETARKPADNDRMDPGQEPAPEVDFAEMERQIQALLGGDAQPHPQGDAPSAPAAAPTPAPDVRSEAIEAEPIDPLIREIDAALSDDADALLRNSNGDIAGAVRSVFDERALSGQEEEINRALIEAFGTSRVERPSFSQPAVTNPLPGFDGAARPLPPHMPREERDRDQPAAAVAPPALASAEAVEASTPSAARIENIEAAAQPAAARTEPAPAAMAAAAGTTPLREHAAPAQAEATTVPTRRSHGSLMQVLLLPLRALAFPMRALPAQAHAVATILAVTLLLWAPVAWWLAQRAAKTPLVGPVRIHAAPVLASGDLAAADAAAGSTASGH